MILLCGLLLSPGGGLIAALQVVLQLRRGSLFTPPNYLQLQTFLVLLEFFGIDGSKPRAAF